MCHGIQFLKWNIRPCKRSRHRHHQHQFSNAEHSIIYWMNSILTRQNIISSMHTRGYFIPALTCIFISILICIIHYYPILNSMRNFCYINIIKCRLSLTNIGNPTFHVRRILSKTMINIIIRYFAHSFQ